MRFVGGLALIFVLGGGGSPAPLHAADIGNGWTQTQVDGGGIQRGDPITLRWSIVPDGESYERSSNSQLIDFLDDGWNVPAVDRTPRLTDRPWWEVINSAYEQYNGVSGLNMVYWPEQTGAGQDTSREGDIRIGGEVIDNNPGGVLGDNVFPNGGDMRIDTSRDANGNPGGIFTNAAPLRNLISHESGHGVGLGHTVIAGADAVMESGLQDHFYGLQFDDIYGFNRLYGDPYEKIGGGNDSSASAYDLGTFSTPTSVAYGTDARDSAVNQGEHDWLGIDGATDQDWFRFTVPTAAVVDVTVSPMGPAYQLSGQNFNAAAQSDLEFAVYKSDNSLLHLASRTGSGEAERAKSLTLLEPGEYFVRVRGNEDHNQFYQLGVNAELPELLLTVNHNTGEIHVSGLAAGAGFDGYRIESPLGGLDPSDGAWQSFQDQGRSSWVEANPTSTSLQELLPAGTDQLALSDSLFLGEFYTQNISEPFGTPQPEDLTFSYLAPGSGDTWLKGAVQFIGTPVPNNLVLTVDPSTGQASVVNQSNTTIFLDGYSIASDSASLDVADWTSLHDQMLADWLEANPNATVLTELKSSGALQLAPGEFLQLGALFAPQGVQDLELSFLLEGDNAFRTGVVEYAVTLPGDYDLDGDVDADDYQVWRLAFDGTTNSAADGNRDGAIDIADFVLWRDNLGATAATLNQATTAVPEPSPAVLLGCGIAVAVWRR